MDTHLPGGRGGIATGNPPTAGSSAADILDVAEKGDAAATGQAQPTAESCASSADVARWHEQVFQTVSW
jgi:hypothetical protein